MVNCSPGLGPVQLLINLNEVQDLFVFLVQACLGRPRKQEDETNAFLVQLHFDLYGFTQEVWSWCADNVNTPQRFFFFSFKFCVSFRGWKLGGCWTLQNGKCEISKLAENLFVLKLKKKKTSYFREFQTLEFNFKK